MDTDGQDDMAHIHTVTPHCYVVARNIKTKINTGYATVIYSNFPVFHITKAGSLKGNTSLYVVTPILEQ